jgi:hybrid polyketide synthase/nonribosomal peptide synthetase FtdB
MRLYRTGDLARWDARGTLHLCGRADGGLTVCGPCVEAVAIEGELLREGGMVQAVAVAPARNG